MKRIDHWFLGALLCFGSIGFGQCSEAATKQGAALLKVDVMAVMAHPDDETGMATALASLALGEGATISNIYCTRGEGGGNMVGTHWGPSLGVLREAELRDCLARLGVRYCFFLEQRDWAYTESMSATLRAWDKERALERLVRYVRALRPEIMMTMNPTPNPGQHGHHQAAAILAIEAFEAAADPNRFPEQLSKEGLELWQARKLYSTGSFSEHGVEVSGARKIGDESVALIVGEALSNHRSQGFGRMLGAPWLNRPRWYTLIKSVTEFKKETSFFEGLPVEGLTPVLSRPSGAPRSEATLTARLVPRPAITRYETWVEAHSLEHIAQEFLPDVPVVLGDSNQVFLEVNNQGPVPRDGKIVVSYPDGIEVEPSEFQREFPSGRSILEVSVKPNEYSDFNIRVSAETRKETHSTKALLHTVPSAPVSQVAEIPSLASLQWGAVDPLMIDESQRVQGRVESDRDSRAEVRLLHDGNALAVNVRVWDDVVVSNISADDVRGHWRSDSVEICFDPKGNSEDSFSCYKVGVFPFVEDQGARAARDADANQGPIEETAPLTRVVSRRRPDGYQVQATIPFSELMFESLGEGMPGFNVIVYDGDKADAAQGENINESRIAWSPRSGVQGRPEDWGRLRFESLERP